MDYRLALFLHLPLGLEIDSRDLANLLSPDLEVEAKDQVASALCSKSGLSFLWKNPHWAEDAQKILAESERQGIHWSCLGLPDYPRSWLDLSIYPAVFSYQGEAVWLNTPLISVVGSRTPTSDTLSWLQRELAEFLNQRGVGVVSGGAQGVDQWAHRQALDNFKPTVCILPSGLLNPFPFNHEYLWRKILDQGGCMLSTCGLKEPLRRKFFHVRNRWIAGLSPVCLVAEANRRSGSQLTARLALEEHKTICTLPVFPTATQGLGNLDLINSGAAMLRDHRDLIALWDLSCPTSLQNLKRESQEDGVDQP